MTEEFVKHWLYNILETQWDYYRFEYAAIRGAIHCHYLAKLKSDPGLCNFASKAVLAKEVREKLMQGVDPV